MATIDNYAKVGEVSVLKLGPRVWTCGGCGYHNYDEWKPTFGELCPGCGFRIAKKIEVS